MRLPLIRHIAEFIENNDKDFIEETLEVLEHLTEFEGLSENELDSLGEIISNLYGALEVEKSVEEGLTKKEALNEFMKRVQQSIDNKPTFYLNCLASLPILWVHVFHTWHSSTSKPSIRRFILLTFIFFIISALRKLFD